MKTLFISVLLYTTTLISQNPITINYFNSEPPPADSVVVFAKGIISLPNRWEEKITFSPDGKEVFFGRHPNGGAKYFEPRIMHAKYKNNKWSVIDTASFSKDKILGYPLLSADGKILYMEQPIHYSKNKIKGQIVFSKKAHNKWSSIDSIIPSIKAKEGFGLAQMTKDSTLYFYDRLQRLVYSTKWTNGTYSKPMPLDYKINPAVEFFVSPDNDYIIFKPINWSNQFHISFKDKNGAWKMPIHFNSYFKKKKWNLQGCMGPSVSPDGKYFFFGKGGDIYWTTTDFIDALRNK